jgi:hypothetical protein
VLRHSRQDSRMGTRSSEVSFLPVLARFSFAIVNLATRKRFGALQTSLAPSGDAAASAKNPARQSGVRGETYAGCYPRRLGSILIARNSASPGIPREIDRVGTDDFRRAGVPRAASPSSLTFDRPFRETGRPPLPLRWIITARSSAQQP